MYQPLSAGDLCTRNVVFAHRDMALGEAAQRMREHHVGCLVVVDDAVEGRVPVGLLTDRDIVIAVVARDVDVRTLQVDDVMSPTPVTAREADSLLDSLAAMRRAGVRRLPRPGCERTSSGTPISPARRLTMARPRPRPLRCWACAVLLPSARVVGTFRLYLPLASAVVV